MLPDHLQCGDWLQVSQGGPECDRLVIAFAGILAMLAGMDAREFSGSLAPAPGDRAQAAAKRRIAFVRERPPRWYNSMDDSHLETLASVQDGLPTITLGNSMGGFAAILFSLVLPNVYASISFCPQYSILRRHVPFEERWRHVVSEIDAWRFETCLPPGINRPRDGLVHILFCGAENRADLHHAELILQNARNPVRCFMIEGCGHDVARHLKIHGLLQPVLEAVIEGGGRSEHIGELLRSRDVAFRDVFTPGR